MSIITDKDLHIENDGDCPDHLDPRDYEAYRVMFAWGREPKGLERGCPLGRAMHGHGGRFGSVADLLFRASLDNPEVTFHYKGEHGEHIFRGGERLKSA